MKTTNSDLFPTPATCEKIVQKAVDHVDLQNAANTAESEPLGGTNFRIPVENVRNKLVPSLVGLFQRLRVEFAVLIQLDPPAIDAVLHVFRVSQKDASRKFAQALSDCEHVVSVLRAARTDRFKSENFDVPRSANVVVAGHVVHNLAAVAIRPFPLLAVFLNRNYPVTSADNTVKASGTRRVPWENIILEEVSRELVRLVSPLQLSDDTFELNLPGLLRNYGGQWVAYHEDRQIGIFETDEAAVRACLKQNIPGDEIYVRAIEQEPPISFGWSALEIGS